ncbi:MAG: M20 family metallopeptidase [Thermodesulfobacteriota bacterium]
MTEPTGLEEACLRAADSLEGSLTEMSDSFFLSPEVGLEERRTSAAMREFLAGFGFAVEAPVGGLETAFRAVVGKGPPVVALLAEMDALPGIGHGCGHNIGGVASVGAAAALAGAVGDRLKAGGGTVIVLGTPAEESGTGKADMIRAGVFDGVDAAMMVHASSARTVVKHFLGLVELRFTFHGRSAHASAYPEDGINALDGVIQTFNSINALRQHLPIESRVHGIITDGGRAPNIVPDRAEALFFVRAADPATLDRIKERVVRCAEGAAVAMGCRLDREQVGTTTAPMKINAAFADLYRGALDYLGLAEDPKPPYMNVGSSDIGDVSQVVPAIHPHVPLSAGLRIHTREFAAATATPEGHRALMEGVKALGLTALKLLFDPAALDVVKEDFRSGGG